MSFIRVDKILKNMNLISKNSNKDIDEDNYFAMNMICSLFDTYPYPLNTLITEKEYLDILEKLAMNFYDIIDLCIYYI